MGIYQIAMNVSTLQINFTGRTFLKHIVVEDKIILLKLDFVICQHSNSNDVNIFFSV